VTGGAREAQGASDSLRISQCFIELWLMPLLASRGLERPATPPGRSRAFALQATALRWLLSNPRAARRPLGHRLPAGTLLALAWLTVKCHLLDFAFPAVVPTRAKFSYSPVSD